MQMMKAHDVKRVLVMSESRLEGIVSLGDLAREGDGENVVEDISRAEPNG
jgi:CBS domain-containing protein